MEDTLTLGSEGVCSKVVLSPSLESIFHQDNIDSRVMTSVDG